MSSLFKNINFYSITPFLHPLVEADDDIHGKNEDLDWNLKSFEDASKCSIKEMSHKRLLLFLCICLLTALLALCVMGALYSKQLGSYDLLKEHYSNAAEKIVGHEQNATELREEFDQLQMSFKEMEKGYQELEARHNTTKERLSSCSHKTVGRIKYYYISTEKLNWMQSRDYCVRTGGQLVKIPSKKVQDYLASFLKASYWIGLNDLDTEGRWMWVDNTTLSGETFWYRRANQPAEPDNWKFEDPNGENCACLDIEGEKLSWYDSSCLNLKKFICEK
ncbi:uncharacterized protein [Misgurnus anguillicaudatus]|uniref:uncharacterized protein isoform X2 n=1 Tax=Misgurnus anguillicaudatus TaxID=75329 RepID=UPI003CCF6CA9